MVRNISETYDSCLSRKPLDRSVRRVLIGRLLNVENSRMSRS